MLGSPKRTNFIWSPFLANTADFFLAPGVRFGLLNPGKVSPRYDILPEGVLFTSFVLAMEDIHHINSAYSIPDR